MLTLQLIIYGYSFLVLLFLLLDSRANRSASTKKSRWFRVIICATMWMLFLEAVTMAVDGIPGTIMYWVVYLSNSLLFILILMPISLWLVYLDECLFVSEKERKKKRIVYICFNLAALAIVIINFSTGILFTVTENNRYIRGDAIYLMAVLNYILYVGYIPTLAKYRKLISGRIYGSIFSLGLLPILGAVVQILSYGTPLIWPMLALAALVAYILIEREETRRDGLTGLAARIQFESRVQFKIDRHQPFSIIMIDIDKFKTINDTYGHEEGDEALKIIANLLEKSIKQDDSAYRYGGDEFILLIESEEPEVAGNIVQRLRTSLDRFNGTNQKPYMLSFSAGTVYFDGKREESLYGLFSVADEMMYTNKTVS